MVHSKIILRSIAIRSLYPNKWRVYVFSTDWNDTMHKACEQSLDLGGRGKTVRESHEKIIDMNISRKSYMMCVIRITFQRRRKRERERGMEGLIDIHLYR